MFVCQLFFLGFILSLSDTGAETRRDTADHWIDGEPTGLAKGHLRNGALHGEARVLDPSIDDSAHVGALELRAHNTTETR